MNTYHYGKEAFRGKQFVLNVITSLIWVFFQMAISLLVYVAIFSGQVNFYRNFFFTLLQSNYFNKKATFLRSLSFRNSYLFKAVIFFRIATFSEQNIYQAATS